MRERGGQTPVLMLTARDRVEDRVRGLQEGADDCLVKPFAFSECWRAWARCCATAAATARPTPQLPGRSRHRPRQPQGAHRAGTRLDLTAKEFTLLTLLLRRGQVLSRTTLAEQVWDMNFDSDTNVVEVAVRRLRAKLDDPFPYKLLHAVRGAGLRARRPLGAMATPCAATRSAGAWRASWPSSPWWCWRCCSPAPGCR